MRGGCLSTVRNTCDANGPTAILFVVDVDVDKDYDSLGDLQ